MGGAIEVAKLVQKALALAMVPPSQMMDLKVDDSLAEFVDIEKELIGELKKRRDEARKARHEVIDALTDDINERQYDSGAYRDITRSFILRECVLTSYFGS